MLNNMIDNIGQCVQEEHCSMLFLSTLNRSHVFTAIYTLSLITIALRGIVLVSFLFLLLLLVLECMNSASESFNSPVQQKRFRLTHLLNYDHSFSTALQLHDWLVPPHYNTFQFLTAHSQLYSLLI